MAIAAFSEVGVRGDDLLDSPWPRPTLRLVRPEVASLLSPVATWTEENDSPTVRTGVDVSVRRQVRASRRVHRHRVAAAVLVVGLLVVLALPVSALGGRPVAAHPTAPVTNLAGHEVSYVVQPGETLWSIASRLDPGADPRPLVSELEARIGSDAVYPGERIALP